MEEAEWTTPKTKSSAASTNDEDAPFVLTFRPGAWLEEHAVDLRAEAPEVFGGYFFSFMDKDRPIWTGRLWDHTSMPLWSCVTKEEGGQIDLMDGCRNHGVPRHGMVPCLESLHFSQIALRPT